METGYTKVGWNVPDTHPPTFARVPRERFRGAAITSLSILTRAGLQRWPPARAQGRVDESVKYANQLPSFASRSALYQAIGSGRSRDGVRRHKNATAAYSARCHAAKMLAASPFKKEAAIAEDDLRRRRWTSILRDATQIHGGYGFL